MPETAVNKNRLLERRKNDIGLTRKVTPMQPEPEPRSMQKSADLQFGRGILAPYSAHYPTPGLWRKKVHDKGRRRCQSDDWRLDVKTALAIRSPAEGRLSPSLARLGTVSSRVLRIVVGGLRPLAARLRKK